MRRLQSVGRHGREADEREVVDLRDVARLMPTLARLRWMQASQCHNVSFEVIVDARPVPAVHVIVAEIRELLLNLIFNAVDAMPEGGRITIATDQADNGSAVISVSDDGVGMSKEIQRQVFQPFFSTKGDHGSGLGLSVCQTIATRHGASLSVESTPKEGTTFTLDAASGGARARRRRPSAPDRIGHGLPRQQHVLLVDDQEEVRASVGRCCARWDITSRSWIGAKPPSRSWAGSASTWSLSTRHARDDRARRGAAVQPARAAGADCPADRLGLDPDAVRPANVVFVLGKPVTMKSVDDALSACLAAPAAGPAAARGTKRAAGRATSCGAACGRRVDRRNKLAVKEALEDGLAAVA